MYLQSREADVWQRVQKRRVLVFTNPTSNHECVGLHQNGRCCAQVPTGYVSARVHRTQQGRWGEAGAKRCLVWFRWPRLLLLSIWVKASGGFKRQRAKQNPKGSNAGKTTSAVLRHVIFRPRWYLNPTTCVCYNCVVRPRLA